ncbi:hypothetical protein [Actinokineospora cianjurensis]|uniref:Uncharacterized protein n=1 Tax=Actinokineospora cianjurensis TaxID=585224 RepID=A0A421AX58_9PSEU|nr:hypothetical protein [Actinokineospora cianjurensis]RLK54427.1 hypothetical protein CLV68_5977 [Actinokineospora cianjurensis]
MNERIDNHDETLDQRLAADLATLCADLDRMLDLDGGLADAHLPRRVRACLSDLDPVLDLDAGLAAILTASRSTNPVQILRPGKHKSRHASSRVWAEVGVLVAGIIAIAMSLNLAVDNIASSQAGAARSAASTRAPTTATSAPAATPGATVTTTPHTAATVTPDMTITTVPNTVTFGEPVTISIGGNSDHVADLEMAKTGMPDSDSLKSSWDIYFPYQGKDYQNFEVREYAVPWNGEPTYQQCLDVVRVKPDTGVITKVPVGPPGSWYCIRTREGATVRLQVAGTVGDHKAVRIAYSLS